MSTVERFPDDVVVLLHEANVTVGCVPVQIDDQDWQAAVFLVLSSDSPCLVDGELRGGPFSVAIDADLHEHENGTAIEIGIDVATPVTHSFGTLLFLTGHSASHFETVKMLGNQRELPLFIGDEYCKVLSKQTIPLNEAMRSGFSQLLDEATGRDAVIRLTGHYDPDKVFTDTLALLNFT